MHAKPAMPAEPITAGSCQRRGRVARSGPVSRPVRADGAPLGIPGAEPPAVKGALGQAPRSEKRAGQYDVRERHGDGNLGGDVIVPGGRSVTAPEELTQIGTVLPFGAPATART